MSRFGQNLRLFLKICSLVAVLLVINLAVAQWNVQWDMTKSGLYTLTDTTRGVLADLDRDVELLFFHADQSNQRSPVQPLWVRTHSCPSCGYEADRDLNAAVNVLEHGLDKLGVVHSEATTPVETATAAGDDSAQESVSARRVVEAGSSALKERPKGASRAG